MRNKENSKNEIKFIDNCHPNDLGFLRMAEQVWRVLVKIVGWFSRGKTFWKKFFPDLFYKSEPHPLFKNFLTEYLIYNTTVATESQLCSWDKIKSRFSSEYSISDEYILAASLAGIWAESVNIILQLNKFRQKPIKLIVSLDVLILISDIYFRLRFQMICSEIIFMNLSE